MLISNADLTRTAIGTVIAVLAFAVIVINTTTMPTVRLAEVRNWIQYNFGTRRRYKGKHWVTA